MRFTIFPHTFVKSSKTILAYLFSQIRRAMKHSFHFLTLITISLICGCTKEGTIKLKDVDDVCSTMDDIVFMNYCYENFDANHDGKVSMAEASAVKTISVGKKGIYSLKGIEYFTQLVELYCNQNKLASLDVSKNTLLVKLGCASNSLSFLDCSKNNHLEELDCSGNKLTDLNISKNSQLAVLYCQQNNLTSLVVSNNTQLRVFYCCYNLISSLDFTELPNLVRDVYSISIWGYQLNESLITITDKKEYWSKPPTDFTSNSYKIKWVLI